jgi:hypothetical protein
MRRDHDWGFFQWFGVGFLVVFGFIAGFSIGLPFFWAGLVLFGFMLSRGSPWPADLGLLAGAGAVCLVIGAITAIDGDLSPAVWLTVGVTLTTWPTFFFWYLRCRPVSS